MATKRSSPFGGHDGRSPCKATSLVKRLCTALNSPISRKVRKALNDADYGTILGIDIDPAQYDCPDKFYRDYLAVSLLSKYPDFNVGIDRTAVGLNKFHAAEEVCQATNQRLWSKYDSPTLGVSGESLIECARLKILSLLGDFDWDAVQPFFGFSGGASTRLPRRKGDPYYKIQGALHVTSNAYHLGIAAIKSSPLWEAWCREQLGDSPKDWLKVVPGNRITTVPKSAKTERVIAIEPDLNMYLQKGLGGFIRNRLRLVGIDLNDQSTNQRFAEVGSYDGTIATIDLSAASDSVSLALCERLLPPAWYEAMLMIRSPRGTLPDGSTVRYHKMSSMGNGFTFELESLIFWALGKAVLDFGGDHLTRRLTVFGDDIAISSWAAGTLLELLSYCGFAANEDKTFLTTRFRESCGKHYFAGVDVTPFYIRKPIRSTERLIWYCNSLRRWSARATGEWCDARFRRCYDDAVSELPPAFRRPSIPEGFGDGGLIGTFSEVRPRFEKSMWVVRALLPIASRRSVDDHPAYLRKQMSWPENGNVLDIQSDMIRYRYRRLYVSQWRDAPVWV